MFSLQWALFLYENVTNRLTLPECLRATILSSKRFVTFYDLCLGCHPNMYQIGVHATKYSAIMYVKTRNSSG